MISPANIVFAVMAFIAFKQILKKFGLWEDPADQKAESESNANSQILPIKAIWDGYTISVLLSDIQDKVGTEGAEQFIAEEDGKVAKYIGLSEQIIDSRGLIWDNEKNAISALKTLANFEELVWFCWKFSQYVTANKVWLNLNSGGGFHDDMTLGQFFDLYFEPENYTQLQNWAKNLPSKYNIYEI